MIGSIHQDDGLGAYGTRLPSRVRAAQTEGKPLVEHILDMETLGGFPSLPAMVRDPQSRSAPHATEIVSARRPARKMQTAQRGA
jgi:hypothetical protein